MKKRHSNRDTEEGHSSVSYSPSLSQSAGKRKHQIISRTLRKRGAIGLSVETLVIIIISLVILSGGITLMYQFIHGAEDIKGQLDQKTQDELERLLVGQGNKVTLPLHVATVQRGESHVFGLGMQNINDNTESFTISIHLNKVTDESRKDVTASVNPQNIASWALYNSAPISIESNANNKEAILIQVPKDALKGEYIFVAEVFDSKNNLYGNPQTFIVKVI